MNSDYDIKNIKLFPIKTTVAKNEQLLNLSFDKKKQYFHVAIYKLETKSLNR